MPVSKLLTGRKPVSFDPISDLTTRLGQITASRSFNDEKIGQLALATESMGSNEEQMLVNVYNNIESTIKTIVQDFDIAVESHQLEAAAIAGIFGSNPKAALSSKLKAVSSDSVVVAPGIIDGFAERPSMALEAYDERENRNSQLFSIVYNLLASRQDDFGETFFPTIVINPSEVGITISLKLFYVYNDFKRSVTGALANYGRKSVIRAYADAEILKNEQTKVVPVLRTGGGSDDNSAIFAGEVPAWSVALGNNINVQTSALKPDLKVDLIGISQTNELLNSGLMGPSDSLDTYIKLEAVYVKVTDGTTTEVIRVLTENIPSATFTYAPQGNYRRMILAMDTDSIVLDSNTLTVTGAAPTLLPELATSKARVQMSINGSVIIDKGEAIVNRGSLALTAMRNAAGQLVTGAAFTTLSGKIAAAEIVGYTLTAYRANSNIRQRGQLLDSQVEYRVLTVPYRSPMSVIIPAVTSGDDTTALQNLITATGIRVSNEAVGTLLKAESALSAYNAVADVNGDLPELSSIGHFYVKPVYFSESIDLATTVDSIKSHEKLKDIRAALVEKIRFYANEMYRQSEYKAAAAVLTGNVGFKPTVIVGTDPVIHNYLTSDGDLRTLGESFDVKIVSTLDTRMSGKIIISFGTFDSTRNTAINPLNFGNLLFSPELTSNLVVSRDGSTSKELMVTPRFAHITVLPVMTALSVSGLPEVTSKVAVYNKVV
jgi:hypothetical protein